MGRSRGAGMLLGFALGAAAGAVGALALGPRGAPAGEALLPAGATGPVGPPAPTPWQPAPAPVAAAPAPLPGAAPGGDPDLGPALARLPIPTIDVGTGAISGTVRTVDGAPLGGVLVQAWRRRSWPAGKTRDRPPEEPDLETAVRKAVEDWHRSRGDRRRTTTGADGTYRLEGLPEGRYLMQAWHEGHRLQAGGGAHEAQPGATVDFTATVLVRVPVTVLGPDGRAPARATIEVRVKTAGSVQATTQAWTPDEAWVELEPGTYHLVATLEATGGGTVMRSMSRFVAEGSEEFPLTVEAGHPPPPVTLAIRSQPGVEVTVRFPPAETPTAGQARVRLLALPAGTAPDLDQLARRGKTEFVYGSHRVVAFGPLEPGRYVVGVSRSQGGAIVDSAVVEVADRLVRVELTLPAADPATQLVVRVVGPDGAAIGDASFMLTVRTENSSRGTGLTPVRRADGSYALDPPAEAAKHLAGERAPGRRVELEVNTPSHGSRKVEIGAGQREVTVRFGAPATLEVTVDGYAGSALAGRLALALVPGTGDADDARSALLMRHHVGDGEPGLGPNGTQRFGPVEAGAYTLLASITDRDDGFGGIGAGRHALTLQPGANRWRMPVPLVYTLTVTVEGDGGGQLELCPASSETGWGQLRRRVPADGRVVFECVPAGRYRLKSWGEPGGEMRVTVPERTEVRFAPAPQNALAVDVTDAGGTLARAGLADGDVILGADGVDFADETAAWAWLRTPTASRLMVRRGATVVEVTVEPGALGDFQRWGGSLEPTER